VPLRIVRRKSSGSLTISGTLKLGSGRTVRIERRAATNNLRLAEEEARVLEASMLRTDWHGERKGTRSFAEAMLAYFEAEPRSAATKARYHRVLRALGDDRPLSEIGQDTVTELRAKLMRPDASSSTVTREIINPIRATMRLAAARKWAEPVEFTVPKEREGRTLYLLPDEAERLIGAGVAPEAAPHLPRLHGRQGVGGAGAGVARRRRSSRDPVADEGRQTAQRRAATACRGGAVGDRAVRRHRRVPRAEG
jgi:hypothetical protein